MEIIAEISRDEYKQVIKDYYLNKDWTKRVAILALIALGLALLSVINEESIYKWRMLYPFFTSYFLIFFIAVFVIPYTYNHYKVRQTLKGIEYQSEKWVFDLSTTGITINNQELARFYPWMIINKVFRKGDHIIFKPASSTIFCLPVIALENEDSDAFLVIITNLKRTNYMQTLRR